MTNANKLLSSRMVENVLRNIQEKESNSYIEIPICDLIRICEYAKELEKDVKFKRLL